MGFLSILLPSTWFGLAILCLTLYGLYRLVTGYRRFRKWQAIYNRLPGEGEEELHWLWGHLHLFPGPNEEGLVFQISRVEKWPRFQTFWASQFVPVVVFYHPDTLKLVLKSSAPKPHSRGTAYVPGMDWLGEGLLIANGEKWARNRRLITPAFHFEILQPYVNVYNQSVNILLDKMSKFADSGEYFEVFSHVGLCSLDIILRCAFSYHTDCQLQGERHPYVQAVYGLSDIWVNRTLKPLTYFDWIFYLTPSGRQFAKYCKFVHGVAEDIIQKRRETLENEGLPQKFTPTGKKGRNLDFLDILLTARDEHGEGLSPLEIRNEVDTFLFEGHDTTTSGISWTLYSIAKDSQIQEKIQAEVDEIFRDSNSDTLDWKDLQKLEYLTLVIKEGLRFHTPVIFIQRELTEDLVVDGMTIPAKTVIGMNLHNLHHNRAVWGDDHDQFKPERFLPENMSQKDPFSFLPFSAGSRNCIGQNFAMNEMKVMIARILHRFTLSIDPDQVVRRKMGLVMRAENGIKLKATRRNM